MCLLAYVRLSLAALSRTYSVYTIINGKMQVYLTDKGECTDAVRKAAVEKYWPQRCTVVGGKWGPPPGSRTKVTVFVKCGDDYLSWYVNIGGHKQGK